jgi:hypothetical protein
VASSLETRVKRLEDAGGGGECPPCSGTTVGYVNGALKSVSKDGRRFTPEEVEAFEGEEEGERCPVCGGSRQEITLGRPVENLSE